MSIDNEEDIWYNYGVNGIQGITVNNAEYVFRKNVMGDVTHIYKLNSGKLTLAAKYVYDAWGKCSVENIGKETIGDVNPIRYRGYYYDKETELYYLNARYYDPETGRFISADSTQYLEPNTVNGLNLYAYCASNPVMNVDPSGRSAIAILLIIAGIVVGTAMGGVVGGLSEMVSDGNFIDGFLGGLANGFISTVGLALGLALSSICPPAGLALAGFMGVASGIVGDIITEGLKTDWKISEDYWTGNFLTKSLPLSVLNGVTNVLSLGLGNMMGGVAKAGESFLTKVFGALKFDTLAFAAPIIIGFPMFAIGVLVSAIIDHKKGRQ